MKWLSLGLLLVVLGTQYRLWLSEDGVREVAQLRQSVATQKAENERLADRNRQLAEEVRDLKVGFSALEERARSELGMVADTETYYQVVPGAKAPVAAPAAPTAPAAPATPGSDSTPPRTAAR